MAVTRHPAVRLMHKLERRLQRWQGRGGGAESIERETDVALGLIAAGDPVILDVGANRGDWSRALLAKRGASPLRLIAFEPSPEHETTLAAIGDPRFEYQMKAVSSTVGEATLHFDAPGSVNASLVKRDLDHINIPFDGSQTVPTTTIDAIVDGAGLERIDFVKIDVEGHELAVLEGAAQSLSHGLIRALSFEFGGGNVDTRTFLRDFWTLLTGYGFDIHLSTPWFGLVKINRYHSSLESFETTIYVAVLRTNRTAGPDP